MYKYRKVIFWIIVMVAAFVLGTYIAEVGKNNIKADIIAEIEANTNIMAGVTNQEHRSNLSGTTAIHIDTRKFCPVCQEKGLKSCVYEGHTTGTLVFNPTWYDEEGNLQYKDTNIYTTYYSCSLGHAWYEIGSLGEGRIEITKDTEDEIIDMDELEDITKELEEDEFIEFGLEGKVIATITPVVSMTFGDGIGKISWEEGVMVFEGNAEESAKLFFEGCLKPIIDKYIESELEKFEIEVEIPEVDLIVVTASGFDVDPIPDAFIKTRGFDPSRYLQDGRLKLDIEGEIYWIRLEKDDEYIPYMPRILELNSYERKVDLMWDFLLSSLKDWEDISGDKSSEGKGN